MWNRNFQKVGRVGFIFEKDRGEARETVHPIASGGWQLEHEV